MKIRLYKGSLSLVRKSGVGRAFEHQESMLRSTGAEVTYQNEPDVGVVLINTVFPDSLLAAWLAKRRGQKVIYYGHSTEEDFRNSFRGSNLLAPLFKKWICRCYEAGAAVITPTEYSGRILRSYGIRKPVFVLSNGIDTDFFSFKQSYRQAFREKYHLTEEDKVVISVGHYIERKGILDFIEIARTMPEVRFFWFGYTNLNLIPAKVKEAIRQAPPNVVFPGYVEQQELREAYCGGDLFCFMSYEETEGIVILEALACGIPTLVRDIPVYDGWLYNGENVYKGTDTESFRRLTEDILEGRITDLTRFGRKTAESRSIGRMGRRLSEIYSTL